MSYQDRVGLKKIDKMMKKFQITNPKSQINSKSQIPMTETCMFGILDIGILKLIWNLVLGIWNFKLYSKELK